MEIGREYFKKHVQTDVSRNVIWNLQTMSWDYLFNYGKGNTIDFTKLNGLVGIFGKNYSGKSSIIDAALFGLFNTTSKGERKNVHIINQNQDKAKCRVEVGIGDDTYKMTRTLERTKTSAKTNLDFSRVTEGSLPESMNGTSRTGTDSNIQSTIGTYKDFILTSLAAQHDSFGFINEGSTKRKEILAKFLDLEIFDEMHKAVKKDSSEMRGYIKHLNGVDWEKKLSRALSEYSEILEEIQTKTDQCEKHTARLKVLEEEKKIIEEQIKAASQRDIDIDATKDTLTEAQNELLEAEEQMMLLSTEISQVKMRIQDLELTMSDYETEAQEAQQKIDFLSHLAEQIEVTATKKISQNNSASNNQKSPVMEAP